MERDGGRHLASFPGFYVFTHMHRPLHTQGPNPVGSQRSMVTYQFSSLPRVPRYPIFPLRALGNKLRGNEDLELEPSHPAPFPTDSESG